MNGQQGILGNEEIGFMQWTFTHILELMPLFWGGGAT